MSRFVSDENLQVHYVSSISNTSAPTAAEISGGTALTSFLLPDGLTRSQPGNTADTANVSSKYNSTIAGSYGASISATFYRDVASGGGVGGTDTAWDTLPRGTTGYLVVAEFGGSNSGAIQANDEVEVWPIEVISRSMTDIARDKSRTFDVEFAVTSAPVDATVAA